jgi:hypothetical protein
MRLAQNVLQAFCDVERRLVGFRSISVMADGSKHVSDR